MSRKLEIFVSSVQIELEDERVIVQNLLNTAPITISQLRKGKYRPCSRNPLLAQCLSYFHRIEERSSGFRRMRDLMLNHGLDQPMLSSDTGYFQVTFPGPGDNVDRVRVPEAQLLVTPAVEALLTDRQKRILQQVLTEGFVTNSWCRTAFGRAYFSVYRDLERLQALALIQRAGKGRATKYVLKIKP